jgi:hypothetical protein
MGKYMTIAQHVEATQYADTGSWRIVYRDGKTETISDEEFRLRFTKPSERFYGESMKAENETAPVEPTEETPVEVPAEVVSEVAPEAPAEAPVEDAPVAA